MVKRERSESVTPPRSPSPEPAPPKKSRAINTAKGVGSANRGGKSKGWDTARTLTLLEAVFDAAAKSIDKDAIPKLGVSKQSVGDQLVKNRNNLRKLAIDLVRAKKGGGGA
ncbi:uncharacterized protein COLE_04936 [Cutaneotrichosporon oleaginosum]|uniref:uncharacterized protein n=1 Tax=Cutaneotrichosporon oleaginosum TaxID=879819 RepID=UPI00132389A7|nr:hypothetical protein COLE_04936 [Cutaneotrichosporon oleaginosum]